MNILKKLFVKESHAQSVSTSQLCNEISFFDCFSKDLMQAKEEVIIESPYITLKRLKTFMPVFTKLIAKGVKVYIITKDPSEHSEILSMQAEAGIQYFEELGIQVLLMKGGHHRKLALIDRKIVWEGSLNILSQTQSREFMRRIGDRILARELFEFLQFDKVSVFKKKLDLV